MNCLPRHPAVRVCVLAVAAVVAVQASTAHAAVAAKNLLFFGNSFTKNYNVPDLVAQIAAADGKAKPYVVGEVADSRSLADQITQVNANPQNNVNNLPAGAHWDAVVMQDLSNRPTHTGNPAATRADAVTLFNKVAANNPSVLPVLYETWAYRPDVGSPNYAAAPTASQWTGANAMQSELRTNYAATKTDLDAIVGGKTAVSPNGDVWESANFSADLYDTYDDKHPSDRGAMLNGLILYATIYQENVSDIPYASLSAWTNLYGLTATEYSRLTALVDNSPAVLAVIPEPTSLAALAAAALLLRRRR